jgi:putative transcriptional regulator
LFSGKNDINVFTILYLMSVLRDKSRLTEIMILLSILKGNKKLKDIAGDVEISMQGVSEYLRTLEHSGYLKNGKVTSKGMEFLCSSLEEIGEFVHNANKVIGKIKVTEAIAGDNIKEGDKVGLFMENGYVHAYKRESSSMGIAIMDANKGEDVGVKDLKGIMDIEYGKIYVYAMPDISQGGSRIINKEKIKDFIKNADKKIGVCGVVAKVALEGIADIDFEFAAVNSAINAAYRGISTILFVSHEMLPYTLQTISESDVNYEVRNVMDIQ